MSEATRPVLTSISPFFIVRDVELTIDYYRDRFGFQLAYQAPETDPFFAILRRDGAQLMVKAILPDVEPLPNPVRHPWARWDAFVHTADPDGLAQEFLDRGLPFHAPLADTDDGLRGFELQDPDGYVLFFARPV